MSEIYGLPDGTTTYDIDQYAKVWSNTGKKLGKILGVEMIGFDPCFTFSNSNNLSHEAGLRLLDIVYPTPEKLTLLEVNEELRRGGEWLSAARNWMQNNIRGGDTLKWSSNEPIYVPFCKLEELALKVAQTAVYQERYKLKRF